MDLTAAISYNGLTAAGLTPASGGVPSTGIVFESVDFGNVGVDAFVDKRALQDGVDASDIYLGARNVTISAGVYGSTRGDAFDRLQDLLAAFSPRLAYNADSANLGFLPFKFYQPTADIATWPTSAYPNGIPLQMYLRPSAPPRYPVRRQETGGQPGKGLSFAVTLQMLARDPRKYLQSTVSQSIATTAQTAAHRGDYPTYPVISWSVATTGSSLFSITIAGQSVGVDLGAASTGSFTLDYASRSLVDASGTSFAGKIQPGARFPEIQPGGSTVVCANNGGVISLVATYREAFA